MKDINYILEMIPHRYPFLLVDRILNKKDQKEIKTLKNVTINEPFFSGHFPEKPIMPGVLILESSAFMLICPSYSSPGSVASSEPVSKSFCWIASKIDSIFSRLLETQEIF